MLLLCTRVKFSFLHLYFLFSPFYNSHPLISGGYLVFQHLLKRTLRLSSRDLVFFKIKYLLYHFTYGPICKMIMCSSNKLLHFNKYSS